MVKTANTDKGKIIFEYIEEKDVENLVFYHTVGWAKFIKSKDT